MTWRAMLAAGTFLALLALGLWLGRNELEPAEVTSPTSENEPAPLTTPPPPLSRGDLIEAAGRVADTTARGVPAPPDLLALAGRRFVLRIPFGCGSGPPASDTAFGWSYDPEEQILRATISPQVWTDAASLRSVAASTPFEAAEGFWITRPWLRVGDCPPPTPQGAPPPSTEPAKSTTLAPAEVLPVAETLAVVELFEPGSRRAARRNGRPFELVARLTPGEIDLALGLRLVLEGRLRSLSEEGPIGCHVEGAHRPPVCFIAAGIDRVAVTDATGRRVLAEWGS